MSHNVTLREELSISDVERLLANPTEEARIEIASKVAGQVAHRELEPRERDLAHEILGFLVHDIAISVRKALSQTLKDSHHAPHDVMLQLARDLDEVAQPVLECTCVLSDQDLVDLVLFGTPAKQCAIASRDKVGELVSEAISRAGDRKAVIVLVANAGATLSEKAALHVAERYPDDEEVSEPLLRRNDLPALVVLRIISTISDRMRDCLVAKGIVDPGQANVLGQQARERSTVHTIRRMREEDMERLVLQLVEKDELTSGLILRVACFGEMSFMEFAFAHLTEVPRARIWRLIHDVGPLGFRAIYARAGLPEAYYAAFRVVLDCYHEHDGEGKLLDKSALRASILAKLCETYPSLACQDLDLLIDRLIASSTSGPQRSSNVA
ncbi:MAG: DUF2336 domain-containing protein [Rhizobiales bacterium]|nr:DUF2336 domain-containing protein [Hyphomicrobiales bacterium]